MSASHVTSSQSDLVPSTLKMVGLSCLTALVVGTGLVYWTNAARDYVFSTAIERGIDLDSN